MVEAKRKGQAQRPQGRDLGSEEGFQSKQLIWMLMAFDGTSLLVKNPPAMQETWVQSLGWEDPLGKGKATHSSILAWRIPKTGI